MSLQYYRIKPSQDIDVLGEHTQVDTIHGTYAEPYRSVIANRRHNEPLPMDVMFPDLELYPKAKFTDIVHSNIPGFDFKALSENAWDCLSGLKLDTHQTFYINLYRGKQQQRYIQLYLVNYRTEDFIDWKNSVLTYWQNIGQVDRGTAPIKSHRAYVEYLRSSHEMPDIPHHKFSVRMKMLVLDFDKINVDLFKLGPPSLGYYVSEACRQRIVESGLTAFDFESVEEINTRNAAIKPWPGYEND